MLHFIETTGLQLKNRCSGTVLYKTGKNIISLFKNKSLNITIDTNLIEMDFPGVTFNLATGKFFPYWKPNNKPLYINEKPNHHPTIINELSNTTSKTDLPYNEKEFQKARPLYINAVKESGYKSKMTG